MKKSIIYIEFILLLIALSCCFIPCLVYREDLVINVYVFDANKIMGYAFMVLLIIGIILRILVIKKKDLFNKKINSFITNYGLITIMLISFILYIASCIYRKSIFLHYGIGFYIVIVLTILVIIMLSLKIVFNKNKNNRKK